MAKRFFSAPVSLAFSEANNVPAHVQILRTGTFYHDQYGDFKIDKEYLAKMVKNFKERVRRVDLAIDYKHDSDDKAAGWIKDLYLSEDGNELWAEVTWTPKGSKVLEDKEFRYLSADFALDYEDNEDPTKKHGPTLMGAGLTNRPFVKDMAPAVELSEGKTNKEIAMDEKDTQIAAMQAELEALKASVVEKDAKLTTLETEAKTLKEAKETADKEAKFTKLLTEGKVVPAQKAAFMSGDAMALAEGAQPVNLTQTGHSIEKTDEAVENAEDELLRLAEKAIKDKKAKNLADAVKLARRENPELVKKLQAKK